jgi:hypothetical protein
VSEILGSMTIREAIDHLPEPDRANLKRWSETFDVRLDEFRAGHIKAYQQERGEETDAPTVDQEVDALLALLRGLQLTGEIDKYYCPLSKSAELTSYEISALPERVRRYIDSLKEEISSLGIQASTVCANFVLIV